MKYSNPSVRDRGGGHWQARFRYKEGDRWRTLSRSFKATPERDANKKATQLHRRLEEWGLLSDGYMDNLFTTLTDFTFAFTTIFFTTAFTICFLIDKDRLFAYCRLPAPKVIDARANDMTQMLDNARLVFSSYFRG